MVIQVKLVIGQGGVDQSEVVMTLGCNWSGQYLLKR